MKNYKVNIDFKKGPSFSVTVSAHDESRAKSMALSQARNCGFSDSVKKASVTEAA